MVTHTEDFSNSAFSVEQCNSKDTHTYFPGSQERKAQGLSNRLYFCPKTNESPCLEKLANAVDKVVYTIILSFKTFVVKSIPSLTAAQKLVVRS